MFTFNFDSNGGRPTLDSANGASSLTQELPSEEIFSTNDQPQLDWSSLSITINIADVQIPIVDSFQIIGHLTTSGSNTSTHQADKHHSDLLPGIYEGGMKLWESTFDLANYMKNTSSELFKNKTVLDLGCGVGILGILAFKLGALSVHFQDYNAEVLTYLTIPSVRMNDPDSTLDCQFWSGDWKNYQMANETLFDVILTSETIYNSDNHRKLHDVIKAKLKPSGEAYVAGKSYYFGVGGSMREFINVVKNESVFTATTVGTIIGVIDIPFVGYTAIPIWTTDRIPTVFNDESLISVYNILSAWLSIIGDSKALSYRYLRAQRAKLLKNNSELSEFVLLIDLLSENDFQSFYWLEANLDMI